MNNKFKIRPYVPKDKEAVLRLLEEVQLSITDLTAKKLDDFLIMEDQADNVIGTIGIEIYNNLSLLRSLAVAPAYQGKGLGKKLVAELEGWAQKQGVKRLFLLTTTAEDFFAGLGYDFINRDEVPELIKETAEFRNICPASAACLQKKID